MLNSGVVALLESATEMRGTELVGYEGEPGWASVLAVEGKSEPEERGQREEREETNDGFRADHEEGSLVEVVNLSLYPAYPSRGCHCVVVWWRRGGGGSNLSLFLIQLSLVQPW
jgi:hypothetical protein